MVKTAIITGITGQDGYFLAKQLLEEGTRVVGVVRRTTPTPERLWNVPERRDGSLCVEQGDVTDTGSILRILARHGPSEFYHLAAQSHVGESWRYPEMTADVTGLGTLRCLEAIHLIDSGIRFYFAGSSEQFGNTGGLLNEDSPMAPASPYAAAKVFGYHITRVYRESHGTHASCGILFNHESEHRGDQFVTQKIVRTLARGEKVTLGNMEARRDWGYAPDYTRAMIAMVRHHEPGDYVIATGASRSVRDFYKAACRRLGLNPEDWLVTDSELERPRDVDSLCGDATRAREVLGWEPKFSFDDLVAIMCDAAQR